MAKTCGRCGVYRHLHPTKRCAKARRSWWWDRHLLVRHVRGWMWLHLTTRDWRWTTMEDFCSHKGGTRDWCEMVDCLLLLDEWDERKSDYECFCNVTLPFEVGPPRYGYCYCVPDGFDEEVERRWHERIKDWPVGLISGDAYERARWDVREELKKEYREIQS